MGVSWLVVLIISSPLGGRRGVTWKRGGFSRGELQQGPDTRLRVSWSPQMSYELWRKLEEEEDGETKGRRPEIGHVFLLDRGKECSALLSSLDP